MRDKFGRFSKGNSAPKTAFKKGIIPWNKNKTGFVGHWKGKKFSKRHKKNLSLARKGRAPWNKGKKYLQITGSKHPAWKYGQYKSREGYVFIYSPKHPYRGKRKYVKRSRLVMEKKLGRYLYSKEIVHHINEIKDDDRIENLQLFPNRSKHISFHLQKRHYVAK